LESLDKNEDKLLKKKINFCGYELAVKLNNGALSLIDSLTNKNIFSVLISQLIDPWVYYWSHIKLNGVDPKKWEDSMHELYADENHLVADICLRTYFAFNGSFNAPTTEQVNVLLKFKADEVKLYDFGLWYDRLARCNPNFNVDNITQEHVGRLMANFGAEDVMDQLVRCAYAPDMKKPRHIREEDLNKIKSIAAGYKKEEYFAWISNDTAQPKNVLVVQDTLDAGALKIELSRPKSIQPPFERVGVIKEENLTGN